ncbi:MAG: hypothetical protein LBG43_06060 [Treponema sp.]|jgi:hypothetical protein|nr:hypothetical protein [Treponema sp.]
MRRTFPLERFASGVFAKDKAGPLDAGLRCLRISVLTLLPPGVALKRLNALIPGVKLGPQMM